METRLKRLSSSGGGNSSRSSASISKGLSYLASQGHRTFKSQGSSNLHLAVQGPINTLRERLWAQMEQRMVRPEVRNGT